MRYGTTIIPIQQLWSGTVRAALAWPPASFTHHHSLTCSTQQQRQARMRPFYHHDHGDMYHHTPQSAIYSINVLSRPPVRLHHVTLTAAPSHSIRGDTRRVRRVGDSECDQRANDSDSEKHGYMQDMNY